MTKKQRPTKKQNKTKKHIHVHGHLDQENAGWKRIAIYGTPQQRGFAHGFLLYREILAVHHKFRFLVKQEMEVPYKKYMQTCRLIIKPILQDKYPEFYQEMEYIVRGVKYQDPNSKIDMDFLVAWNSFLSMYEYFHNPTNSTPSTSRPRRCSAFIATGSHTKTGHIVMGHTTHSDLVSAKFFNIILYMIPDKGIPFVMQTAPGFIASGTDWFLTKNGLIGCETTIGDIRYRPIFDSSHHPYFCRIRQAMQYGTTLKQYADIMTNNNAGDYACSWLFGDIRTQEIMLCELGLQETNVQTTRDGVYWGMNSAMSSILRDQETDDQEFYDMRTSSGARNARFQQLLEKWRGKITDDVAILILSDHVDPYTQKENPSAKSICVHSYQDSNAVDQNYPHGCTDVKVTTSEMAKHQEFMARFGPACGRTFSATDFFKQNPKYRTKFGPYLENFPNQPIIHIKIPNHLLKNLK